MQCHELEQIIEQDAAQPLPADAQAHLKACSGCRSLVADLEAIEAVARELKGQELEPPARVWTSLRGQLKAEGLIHAPRRSGWLAGWLGAFPRPVLAGAYVAAVLIAAAVLGLQVRFGSNQPEVALQTQPATTALSQQLNSMARSAVSELPARHSNVNASLRHNLEVVDSAIAMCEKSVHEDPQNQVARDYLYGAYQQKAELLAMMVDRGATGD